MNTIEAIRIVLDSLGETIDPASTSGLDYRTAREKLLEDAFYGAITVLGLGGVVALVAAYLQ